VPSTLNLQLENIVNWLTHKIVKG